MDFTVLIAEIPSAPPSRQAFATPTMSVIFGVIFARTGREEPLFTAAQYFRHSSGLVPTSDPISWDVICGQDKFISIISAPASVTRRASSTQSSSLVPIMDAIRTLSGYSSFRRFTSARFSSRECSAICSIFLKPTNGVPSFVRAANRGETSSIRKCFGPIVLKTTPPHPVSYAFLHIS